MFDSRPRRAMALLVIALAAVCALASPGQAQLEQPPTVEIDHPDDGDVLAGEVNVTGNASSLDNEVERVEVRIDEEEWREANGTERWNITWETTLWSSGAHNVTARSWDGEQYSENETVNVTVDQPPTVSILAPEANATVGGQVNVTGTVEDPEGSVEHVQVRVDEGPWQNATVGDGWWQQWDTTEIPSGAYNVTARASDGNWTADDTVNVTVDQPPSVRIDEPSEGATLEGTVELSGTASDREDGVELVEVRLGEGPWRPVEGTTDWAREWDTTTVDDGDYQLSARADDGNHTTTGTVNVTVQNQAPDPGEEGPSVSIAHPADGARVNGTVTIEGQARAGEGTLEEVQVRIDHGTWATADVQGSAPAEWQIPWDAAAESAGDHTVTARAVAGNATATDSVNVTVEDEATDAGDRPSVTITQPREDAAVSGTVTFQGTAEAPQGSIERIQIRVGDGPWLDVDPGSPWAFEWDSTAVEDGPRTVTVNATAERGIDGQASTTIFVSNEDEPLEPTETDVEDEVQLSIGKPTPGTTASDELTLIGSVQTAEQASVAVEYRIDGGSWNEVLVSSNAPFERTVDVSDLEEGEHTLTVRAVSGDQTSEEETVPFTVEASTFDVPGAGPLLLLTSLAAASLAAGRSRNLV